MFLFGLLSIFLHLPISVPVFLEGQQNSLTTIPWNILLEQRVGRVESTFVMSMNNFNIGEQVFG